MDPPLPPSFQVAPRRLIVAPGELCVTSVEGFVGSDLVTACPLAHPRCDVSPLDEFHRRGLTFT
jgi:hypothetical protein